MGLKEELEKLGTKSKSITLRFSSEMLEKIDKRVEVLNTDRTKYLTALVNQDIKGTI
jgi:predicted DNA binding CopG/RHH family protein